MVIHIHMEAKTKDMKVLTLTLSPSQPLLVPPCHPVTLSPSLTLPLSYLHQPSSSHPLTL